MSVPTNYDPVLKMIVELSTHMADDTQGRAETGITLSVDGILVSGYITTARQFMLSHPTTEKLLETVEREFKEAGLFGDDRFEYIHLSNAKFFVPGHPPIPSTEEGVFWRGRLSEIAGFNFGVLGLGPPPNHHEDA